MTEIESKNVFVLIGQTFGIPKSVVYSLISAMIVGAVALSFAFIKTTGKTNAELPIEQERIQTTNDKVDKVKVDVEVVKTDLSNVKQSVVDVKEEQKSQREILLQILYKANQTYNNTK